MSAITRFESLRADLRDAQKEEDEVRSGLDYMLCNDLDIYGGETISDYENRLIDIEREICDIEKEIYEVTQEITEENAKLNYSQRYYFG